MKQSLFRAQQSNHKCGSFTISLLELVIVDPLGLSGQDATIGNSVFKVGFHLQELVGRAEDPLVLGAAVSDNDLRRILVGHHNGRLG